MDNDGIKRGDRADTGDLEAREADDVSEAGSGVQGGGSATGNPTADPSALGDAANIGEGRASGLLEDDEADLTIVDATDPSLGLTNVGDVPADDWAADTGPTRSGESDAHGVSRELADDEVSEDGRRIEFERKTGTGRRR